MIKEHFYLKEKKLFRRRKNETEEKHKMLEILDKQFQIDYKDERLPNVIKIYTKSIFNALNDGNPNLISLYKYEL